MSLAVVDSKKESSVSERVDYFQAEHVRLEGY